MSKSFILILTISGFLSIASISNYFYKNETIKNYDAVTKATKSGKKLIFNS